MTHSHSSGQCKILIYNYLSLVGPLTGAIARTEEIILVLELTRQIRRHTRAWHVQGLIQHFRPRMKARCKSLRAENAVQFQLVDLQATLVLVSLEMCDEYLEQLGKYC